MDHHSIHLKLDQIVQVTLQHLRLDLPPLPPPYRVAAASQTTGTTGSGNSTKSAGCQSAVWLVVPDPAGIVCSLFQAIALAVFAIVGMVVTIIAFLLNFVVGYTVANLATHLGASDLGPIVNTTWSTFRDLSNIFFIFILLYISIALILRLESFNTKKILSMVIVIALLINFSLFFTEVIIDGTNILTLTFLNAIETPAQGSVGATLVGFDPSGGIATAFLSNLGLSSFLGGKTTTGTSVNQSTIQFNNTNYVQAFIQSILMSGLLLFVGVVLLIACVLFIVRYVVLVFLIIVSPVAFASMILPKTNSMIAEKWWKTLFDQSIFPVVFFALMWVTLQIIGSNNFNNGSGCSGQNGAVGFLSTISGGALDWACATGFIFHLVIAMGFLITSLVISKSMASSGGAAVSGAVNAGTKLAGRTVFGGTAMIGRNTVGNMGRK